MFNFLKFDKMLTCSISPVPFQCEIEIQSGILHEAQKIVEQVSLLGSKAVIITNEKIAELYGHPLCQAMMDGGVEAYLLTLPDGEQHKTRQTKEFLEDQMFEKQLGRDTCLIAIGGGVVLDIAAYIAATYCRGIPLMMIPTTLLGMVDACIGGKTGVNVPYGKNLVGCLYQSKMVYIDPAVLATLPAREMRHGAAEMIKHGLIADPLFFNYLEQHADRILAAEPSILEKAIYESCRIKRDIVEEDDQERGKRRLLNFGHTIGHALEKLSNYTLLHGEAVAIGLRVESYLSLLHGGINPEIFARIEAILRRYQLPLQLPFQDLPSIRNAMALDKKSQRGSPRFVMIREIGCPLEFEGEYCTAVEDSMIMQALSIDNKATN